MRLGPLSFFRTLSVLLSLAALLAAGFSGCEGGTSTEAGNPSLAFSARFEKEGKAVAFQGTAQAFAAKSDPVFTEFSDDNTQPSPEPVYPNVLTLDRAEKTQKVDTAFLSEWITAKTSLTLMPADKELLEPHPVILPGPKGLDFDRKFNLLFIRSDSLATWIENIAYDPATGKIQESEGLLIDTLTVDLKPLAAFQGRIDTAGLGSSALMVFVPGSVFHAPVHGDRFQFKGLPQARLAFRLLTADGKVRNFKRLISVGQAGSDSLIALDGKADSVTLPPKRPTLSPPLATPAGGGETFTDSVIVTLAAEARATVRYTLDGSIPNRISPTYSEPLVLRAPTTLKAAAYLAGYNSSPVSTFTYAVSPRGPVLKAPTASPTDTMLYFDSLEVTLSAETGAEIRYTLDGSTPSVESALYATPITLRSTTTVKAAAFRTGFEASPAASFTYRINAAPLTLSAPKALPAGGLGKFDDSVNVTLTAEAATSVRYTLDGSSPTDSSTLYTAPVTVRSTATLKAVAFRGGSKPSPVAAFNYQVKSKPVAPQPGWTLAAPTADPAANTAFTDVIKVMLSAEAGTAVRYTLDGSAPGPSSPLYEGPIVLRGSATILAAAFRDANRSQVSAHQYLLVPAAPRIEPGPGAAWNRNALGQILLKDSIQVFLEAAEQDAQVFFTFSGLNPVTNPEQTYKGPFWLHGNMVIKAASLAPGLGWSEVRTEVFQRDSIPQ